MHNALFILACLIIPAIWGLVASWAFDALAARRRSAAPDTTDTADSTDMYHI